MHPGVSERVCCCVCLAKTAPCTQDSYCSFVFLFVSLSGTINTHDGAIFTLRPSRSFPVFGSPCTVGTNRALPSSFRYPSNRVLKGGQHHMTLTCQVGFR